MIPQDLQIFRFIYEYRLVILGPLLVGWLIGGICYLVRGRKKFFLWLLLFPLFLQPLNIAATYCGWHYRMELRERFGTTPQGWVNIDLMPPEIRAEYAKHDYHPRFRDMKAMVVGTIVLTPLLYLVGGIIFLLIRLVRRKIEGEKS